MPGWVKWIDLPPIWLIATLALAWCQTRLLPIDLAFGSWGQRVGGVLVGLGLALIVAALWEMRRHQTTPVPHLVPSALVTSGVFAWSRNPIYLGDVLILIGLLMRWEAVWSFPLVPGFVWMITARFIYAEEARCERTFGEAFEVYRSNARRWL